MAMLTVREALKNTKEHLRVLASNFDKRASEENDQLYGLLISFSIPSLPETLGNLLVEYQASEGADARETVRCEIANLREVVAVLDGEERVEESQTLFEAANRLVNALDS